MIRAARQVGPQSRSVPQAVAQVGSGDLASFAT